MVSDEGEKGVFVASAHDPGLTKTILKSFMNLLTMPVAAIRQQTALCVSLSPEHPFTVTHRQTNI